MSTPAQGWPVLVGPGRRRDYSTLLAPDFLVAGQEYGVLAQALSPFPDDAPPRTVVAPLAGGRRLAIVYVTYPLTTADLGGTAPTPGEPPRPFRDEHSRPLRLMYGIACSDALIDEPAEVDLGTARTYALRAYRRFLDDEEGFTVLASESFPLRSRTTPLHSRTAAAPVGAVPTPPDRPRPRPRRLLWLGAAIVAVAILTVLAILVFRPEAESPCPGGLPQPGRTPGPTAAVECEPGGPPSVRPRGDDGG
ncbi:hypothetical protein [Micromonospora sp. NPDC004704]